MGDGSDFMGIPARRMRWQERAASRMSEVQAKIDAASPATNPAGNAKFSPKADRNILAGVLGGRGPYYTEGKPQPHPDARHAARRRSWADKAMNR